MNLKNHVDQQAQFEAQTREFAERLNSCKSFAKDTIKSISQRSGLSLNIVERMLIGERMARPNEMLQLARAYNADDEIRFMGYDWTSRIEPWKNCVRSRNYPDGSVQQLTKLRDSALTMDEYLQATYYLADAYQNELHDSESQYQILTEAYDRAKKMEFSSTSFVEICHLLCQALFQLNDSDGLLALSDELKQNLQNVSNLEQKGTTLYYQGFGLYLKNEHKESLLSLSDCLTIYKLINHHHVPRVINSMAHIEFHLGNLEQALNLLSEAIGYDESAPYMRTAILKDYSRVLVLTGQEKLALKYLRQALEYMDSTNLNSPALRCKIHLVLSDLSGELGELPDWIQKVDHYTPLACNAHQVLGKLYAKQQNSAEKVAYHIDSCVDILKSLDNYETWRKGVWY